MLLFYYNTNLETMLKNNEKITPLNVLDVVQNPQNYDDQTRTAAINIIFNNATVFLGEIDKEEKEAIIKKAEKSNITALDEIRNRIKNINQ